MINWIKKVIVRFLTRGVLVVSNKATQENFILSHITNDGYVSLLTDGGSYLPVSYSVYKKMFEPKTEVIDIGDEILITGTEGTKLLLSDGRSIPLASINEHGIEDSLDSEYL
jgi:hypothetical protein